MGTLSRSLFTHLISAGVQIRGYRLATDMALRWSARIEVSPFYCHAAPTERGVATGRSLLQLKGWCAVRSLRVYSTVGISI